MKSLTRMDAELFLKKYGISSPRVVEEVLSGFDFRHPVYEQLFEEGQELFQFIRNPSATNLSPCVGNWFALPGATTQGVAIIDGGAGRRFHRFRVERAFMALEGTAREFPLMWKFEIGGRGGATQIYVPPSVLGYLSAIAPAERY
jgi:hypothetical protein